MSAPRCFGPLLKSPQKSREPRSSRHLRVRPTRMFRVCFGRSEGEFSQGRGTRRSLPAFGSDLAQRVAFAPLFLPPRRTRAKTRRNSFDTFLAEREVSSLRKKNVRARTRRWLITLLRQHLAQTFLRGRQPHHDGPRRDRFLLRVRFLFSLQGNPLSLSFTFFLSLQCHEFLRAHTQPGADDRHGNILVLFDLSPVPADPPIHDSKHWKRAL